MSNLSFRRLDPSDLFPCLSILKENYPETYEYWKQFFIRDVSSVYFLVAMREDTLVGFGAYLPLENQPNIFRLIWINVPPKEQGRGIGKALVTELERKIKLNYGTCMVVLETDKPVFYNKLGYSSYQKNWESDLMIKSL